MYIHRLTRLPQMPRQNVTASTVPAETVPATCATGKGGKPIVQGSRKSRRIQEKADKATKSGGNFSSIAKKGSKKSKAAAKATLEPSVEPTPKPTSEDTAIYAPAIAAHVGAPAFAPVSAPVVAPDDAAAPVVVTGAAPLSAPVTVPVASAAPVPPAPPKAAKKGKKASNWTEPEEEWLRSTVKKMYGEPVPKNSSVDWRYIAQLWAKDWPKARTIQSLAVKYSHLIGNYRGSSNKMRNRATRDENEAGGKGAARAQEKEMEELAASKKRCRAIEVDDDNAPAAKKLREAPATPEQEGVIEEVTEPEGDVDWHTPVTFTGDDNLHREMSPTQADYVCLVVLRQFIFRGIPEVDWTQVRDGYNAKFSPQPEATLGDIFWNYCQWFKDLSGFGPGVERSISVGEWGRVLRMAAGEQVEAADKDIEMSDSGSVCPGEDATGIGEHPASIVDSLIMDGNRQIVLGNAAATNPNSVIFEEDSDPVADDTTLLELTNAPPPEHPREDGQMLVDEFAIVNDRDSKSRSPEPFLGDESASHEPGVSIIDDSSVFDEYARNRQIALDNAAAMNSNSIIFEEGSDPVAADTTLLDPKPVADDTIPVEPADAPPPEHPKDDDQKPVNQPRPAKTWYSRSQAIWRQIRLSRTP
jgi:hypothetical protein